MDKAGKAKKDEVRHRIDGLEKQLRIIGNEQDVRHRIDGLEMFIKF